MGTVHVVMKVLLVEHFASPGWTVTLKGPAKCSPVKPRDCPHRASSLCRHSTGAQIENPAPIIVRSSA